MQRLSKSGRIISNSVKESVDIGVTGGSFASDFAGGDMLLQHDANYKTVHGQGLRKGRFLRGFDTVQYRSAQSLNNVSDSVCDTKQILQESGKIYVQTSQFLDKITLAIYFIGEWACLRAGL